MRADSRGLNNKGEVAFKFTLADTRQGIALWSTTQVNGQRLQTNGDDVYLTWTSPAGTTNYVQAATTPGGNFDTLSGPIVAVGAGLVASRYIDVGGATNRPARFYRICRPQ